MVLRDNLYYWNESLKNPESVGDEHYAFDEIIVENEELTQKIQRLRELVISYCITTEKDKNVTSKILDEIYTIITSIDKIQYTEFIAFWKSLDISYSVFQELIDQKVQKDILNELLQKYCEKRLKLYDRLGYSNITVQALYDSGASRKKGAAGVEKLVDLIRGVFGNIPCVKDLHALINISIGYFLPDKGDERLFREFCNNFNVKYRFGGDHQGKVPDMVLKVNKHFFIIEAKHIKESGGAQDKQIVETIEFIRYSENSSNLHYLSFMDGVYFNNFISVQDNISKVGKQKEAIERNLNNNKNNFFVNTAGLKSLLKDLSRKIRNQ
jgi:hypothetical protein